MKNDCSYQVIGCAIETHRTLGPGLLESCYEKCLAHELRAAKLPFKTQYPIPIDYKGIRLDCGFRIDVLVDETLIVELKAVKELENIHEAQLLTYMKLSKVSVGLLVNFNVTKLKDGLRRYVL